MTKCNVENRSIFCRDNIDILQSINSNCIDLIYLDPPFNKKKTFTAPIGSSAEGASFKDIFRKEDLKEEWLETIKEDHDDIYSFLMGIKGYGNNYNFCYLAYMAIRLIEMHRVLKDTGSLYLHCDQTMSHYLKILLDTIFGEKNFRNEIVWKRTHNPKGLVTGKKSYSVDADILLFYSKTDSAFIDIDKARDPLDAEIIKDKFNKKDNHGAYYPGPIELSASSGRRPNQEFSYKGYSPPHGWRMIRESLIELDKKGNLGWNKNERPFRKIRPSENKGMPINNLWIGIKRPSSQSSERVGYPTQKPLALLERIIKASSKEGDMVLDPFCGCATTCIASEKLNRKWVGIDVSHKAYELVNMRLAKELEKETEFFGGKHKSNKLDISYSTKSPVRTDHKGEIKTGKFVYVIGHKKHKGWHKVGIASNVKARLNGYQTSDPQRAFMLEFSMKKEKFRECEKHIHNKFENQFEWVKGDVKEIVKEIKDF